MQQKDEERKQIQRGDIYYIRPMRKQIGSEQHQGRPALIVSNDKNNLFSSVVEIAYITKQPKKNLPTHVKIQLSGMEATILCEQIQSVSVKSLGNFMGHLQGVDIANVNRALMISLGIITGESDKEPDFLKDSKTGEGSVNTDE